MSHYKPYPAYKDLGAQWLEAIPIHWNTSSLKWKTKRFAGGTPDKTNSKYWENGTIPWLASGEVNQKLITQPTTHITEDAYKNSSAKWIPSGSLVMALAGQGKTRGTVAQLAIESTCNQSMAAIVPNGINARFLYWWLDSNYSNLRGLSGDDVRDGLNLEVLGQITCPLPTGEEQEAISGHLDRETARIDALVEKKTRFIELLREKRQALITHAVTKGLDPKVKMKDSGVEWLGEVPEGWVAKKVAYWISTSGSGTTPAKEQDYCPEEDGGIPWVTTGELRENTISTTQKFVTTSAINEYSALKVHPAGSLVIAMYGATVGRLAMLGVPSSLNQACFAIHPCNSIILDFLRYWIEGFRAELMEMATGAGQPNISADKLRNLIVAAPKTLDGQMLIVNFIIQETSQLDTLIEKSERSIELLKERRSALITAAVTGQIDLREAA